MSRWIDIETPGGPLRAWRSEPSGRSKGAVLVIQEIFGVNAHIRSVADRIAGAGFVALAPALFDRIAPGVELGYDAPGVARGLALAQAVGLDGGTELLGAACTALQAEGLRTGAIGFCWGGSLAFLANTRLGLPAVSYYGARTVPFLDEPLRAPMMFHFGDRDPSITAEAVEAHRRSLPGSQVHVYPAGHGFNCEQRADFEPASAALAWQRSIGFLTENLR
ncbi:MAG: dienelactone hydrolase family protein [Pseudomonadota bacterium]|nr:dienelactone hydrolase family protein [Pseudomonadota bacterium]